MAGRHGGTCRVFYQADLGVVAPHLNRLQESAEELYNLIPGSPDPGWGAQEAAEWGLLRAGAETQPYSGFTVERESGCCLGKPWQLPRRCSVQAAEPAYRSPSVILPVPASQAFQNLP